MAVNWLKLAHWRADYHDFVDWFFRRGFNTPHSTKQIEDAISWALETDAETLIARTVADIAAPATRRDQLAPARRVRCPVLVISARNEKVTAHADASGLAKATGGELLCVADGGHNPQGRKPVPVNLARCATWSNGRMLRATAGRPAIQPSTAPRGGRGRGTFFADRLGPRAADAAIARELRKLVPDLEIEWLAQDPVTRVLAAEWERIHPASAHLASESGHIESKSAEHDLHCFQAYRRMNEILVAKLHGVPPAGRGAVRLMDRR